MIDDSLLVGSLILHQLNKGQLTCKSWVFFRSILNTVWAWWNMQTNQTRGIYSSKNSKNNNKDNYPFLHKIGKHLYRLLFCKNNWRTYTIHPCKRHGKTSVSWNVFKNCYWCNIIDSTGIFTTNQKKHNISNMISFEKFRQGNIRVNKLESNWRSRLSWLSQLTKNKLNLRR